MKQRDFHTLDDRTLGIDRVKYSPRGDWIIGAGGFMNEPGQIAIWDACSHQRRTIRIAPRPKVTALAFAPDQALMASSCENTDSVELWETASWRCIGSLAVLSPPFRRNAAGILATTTNVGDLIFSEDGRFLAAGCWDTTAKVWEMETRTRREFPTPDRSNADTVAFLGGTGPLVIGTYQTLSLWEHLTGSLEKKLTLSEDAAWHHLTMGSRQQIASISHKGDIRIWSAPDWNQDGSHIRFKRDPCAWAYSAFSDLLAIGFDSGEVYFWSVPGRKVAGRWRLTESIMSISFSPIRASVCIVTSAPEDRVVEYDYVL